MRISHLREWHWRDHAESIKENVTVIVLSMLISASFMLLCLSLLMEGGVSYSTY